ncbi:MAG: transglutaminase domain-containing protein [Bryobacteraceae bacterium]
MKRRTFLVLGAPLWGAGKERRIKLEYAVAVKGASAAAPVDVWMPVPVSDGNQTVSDLEIRSAFPVVRTEGDHGNRLAYVQVREDTTIVMRLRAVRRERVAALGRRLGAGAAPLCCLEGDRLVPVDGKIREWAREVVEEAGAGTDLEMARAIYNHVVSTVKYDKSGKGWGRGDIYYACDSRRGNCTDFHAIFIGYARAMEIPARFAIGYPLPRERGAGTIAGYHCWAEFWAQGVGWIPIDASEAAKDPARREYFFGAHDENRVEFSRGRDVVLRPRQKGEPLNFLIDAYGERDGLRWSGVTTTVRYEDEGS